MAAQCRATPDPVVAPDEADPLACVFVKLGRLVERRMNDLLRGQGISAAHAVALCALDARPGTSRAELARDLQVTPQAAGGVVDKLVERGLVTREPTGPGLSVELGLTEAGRRTVDEIRPIMDHLRQDILRLFRPEAAAFLDGAPRHLLKHL